MHGTSNSKTLTNIGQTQGLKGAHKGVVAFAEFLSMHLCKAMKAIWQGYDNRRDLL